MSASVRRRRPLEIWPAFVDATASLLMVVVFVLMVASVGQLVLTSAISGRDATIDRLNAEFAALADRLSMQAAETKRLSSLIEVREASLKTAEQALAERKAENAALGARLAQQDATVAAQERDLAARREELAALNNDIAALTALRDSLQSELEQAVDERDSVRERLAQENEINIAAQAQIELLNRQLTEVSAQLGSLTHALEISEADNELKQATIDKLGQRLNLALATKVQQLARYRSAFFAALSEALKGYPGIEIVGDRFVLPSTLLFESGSAELGEAGRRQIVQIADILKTAAARIPPDIDWIVRIDGHTDDRVINTPQYPSNWELSAARAITIVRALVAEGIPSRRLAATGFGEFHPIDPDDTPVARARNRRIEIKLTSR